MYDYVKFTTQAYLRIQVWILVRRVWMNVVRVVTHFVNAATLGIQLGLMFSVPFSVEPVRVIVHTAAAQLQ